MSRRTLILIASVSVFACAQADEGEIPAADPAVQPAAAEPQDRVVLAMSAGPAELTSAAGIVDFDASGNLQELRAGTNGWICLPDDPSTPGDDPMCLDATWQQWLDAYVKKTAPSVSGVGIGYMLHGGRVPSNTDPFATAPASGESWVDDGPHMMVIAPDPAHFNGFPTDPANGGPYVMWKGTPYAHLMVPLGSMEGMAH